MGTETETETGSGVGIPQRYGTYVCAVPSDQTKADLLAWAGQSNLPPWNYHVTIAYSRRWVPASTILHLGSDGRPESRITGVPAHYCFDHFVLREAPVSDLPAPGTRLLVLRFWSAALDSMFNRLMKAGATYDFGAYKPHVTLGKVPIPQRIFFLPTFPLVFDRVRVQDIDFGADGHPRLVDASPTDPNLE